MAEYRYQKIVRLITDLIQAGTYSTGERIPSVRQMGKQQHVSLSTVLKAYLELENQGLIEARPQSGYYVRRPDLEPLPEPVISAPSADPSLISLHDLVMRIVNESYDPDLIQLGAAMPNLELLPTERLNRIQIRLIRQAGALTHRYELPPGLQELRVQIARRALNAGCHFSPSDITVTSGGTEAIDLCLYATCQPGDIVAIESPMYFGTLQSLEAHGLRALEIPTHQNNGISITALRFALAHNRIKAVLVMSNFNNPLGSSMPDKKKRELVALLAEHEIPLIENDVHGEIYFGDTRPSVAKAYDKKGLVLLCSSYSKDISPAMRIGWVAAGRYQQEVTWRKFTSNAAAPTLFQMVIAEFLDSGGYEHHLRTLRREYARNIRLLSQAITRHFPAGTRVTRPKGGFVLWVQLAAHIDAMDVYKLALENKITVTPGSLFSPTNQFSNFIRLNAASWTYPIERAVEKLGEIVASLDKPE